MNKTQKQIDKMYNEAVSYSFQCFLIGVLMSAVLVFLGLMVYNDLIIKPQLSHKADRICVNETYQVPVCNEYTIIDSDIFMTKHNVTLCSYNKIETKEVCDYK